MSNGGHLNGQKAANRNACFDSLEHRVHGGDVGDVRHQRGAGGNGVPGILKTALIVMELQAQHQIPGPLVEGSFWSLTQPHHIGQIGHLQDQIERTTKCRSIQSELFYSGTDTGKGRAMVYQ